jgi:hypothetical protein
MRRWPNWGRAATTPTTTQSVSTADANAKTKTALTLAGIAISGGSKLAGNALLGAARTLPSVG